KRRAKRQRKKPALPPKLKRNDWLKKRPHGFVRKKNLDLLPKLKLSDRQKRKLRAAKPRKRQSANAPKRKLVAQKRLQRLKHRRQPRRLSNLYLRGTMKRRTVGWMWT